MARIFITGSADGLGRMAAELLLRQQHNVVLHARSEQRAAEVRRAVPGAEQVLVGDLASLAEVRALAQAANAGPPFDAVIHNAGVGYQEPRSETVDGLEHVFAINVLSPYLLTALMARPQRLIYLSSGMHRGGEAKLDDPQWKTGRWNASQAYSTSKLFDTVLAFAVARRWPEVFSNSVDPGWVATKMGGPQAPDDLEDGRTTQAWLAASDDAAAKVSGAHFYHRKRREPHPAARDVEFQEQLLEYCAKLTGVPLP